MTAVCCLVGNSGTLLCVATGCSELSSFQGIRSCHLRIGIGKKTRYGVTLRSRRRKKYGCSTRIFLVPWEWGQNEEWVEQVDCDRARNEMERLDMEERRGNEDLTCIIDLLASLAALPDGFLWNACCSCRLVQSE